MSFDFETVIPLVICQREGGELDDDAFIAGWTCGAIDLMLEMASQVLGVALRVAEIRIPVPYVTIPQLDLIAMKHGYTVLQQIDLETEDDEEWVYIRFEKGDEHGGL